MTSCRFSFLALALALSPSLAPPAPAGDVAQDVRSAMDPTADPCQDFYRYACGGWLDTATIPADETRWARSFSTIQERNRELIRSILEEAAASPGDDPDRQRLGALYGACMDEAAVEGAGLEPLAPWLAEIARVSDATSLVEMTAKLQQVGARPLFSRLVIPDFAHPDVEILFLSQGGLGMPDRDYYVSDDPKKKELLAAYRRHVTTMLGLLGETPDEASRHAAQVVALETELARVARPRAEMREFSKLYNKIDRAGLAALAPGLDWNAYFAVQDRPEITDISVATPETFAALDNLLTVVSPEALQAYLRWHLVHSTAELLPDRFVTADFDFFGRTLSGQQEIRPRWKRCAALTQAELGEAVGKVFVERAFAGDSKAIALEMIESIEAAFAEGLPRLAWMDDATRVAALEKAKAVGNKIGYPDSWRDYSSIEIRPGALFSNALAARRFEEDRELAKVGRKVDPAEWGMTPQTVNASYNPLRNEMSFPAGILQPPFFHRDFPAAMRFGGIGSVMGHELSHGFDDQGRRFAAGGELREWWGPEATQRYVERTACVEKLYSGYEVEPGVAVNGKLTLGENVADLGGVKQAYRAFERWQAEHGGPPSGVEGLSPEQLFFVSVGQVWCQLSTPESARLRITTDPHSPGRFRVVGPLSSFPAFGEAFSCPVGSPMRPAEVCEVW